MSQHRTPPKEWEAVPSEARRIVHRPGSACGTAEWAEPYKSMIEGGLVEVEYRQVVNRPDPRNRFWWRLAQPKLPLEATA